jgi:acyl dehydratase
MVNTESGTAKVVINNFAEFEKFVGKEIGVSEWLTITQKQINLFADATLDHQWIHTDPERAARESHFKKTIAHGFLTVSVIPYLWHQIAEVNNIKMLVNYGIESLRFREAVVVDSELRMRVSLNSITNLRGIAKASLSATLEIKGNPKPALDATIIFLYHFK